MGSLLFLQSLTQFLFSPPSLPCFLCSFPHLFLLLLHTPSFVFSLLPLSSLHPADLFKREHNPPGEPSSWHDGPSASPRHHLCQADCVRGVCVPQRQALPVPSRERLHLPDHQQCVLMELREGRGPLIQPPYTPHPQMNTAPTPERPSSPSPFFLPGPAKASWR